MFKYLPLLLEKEYKQILKDKSVFVLAFIFPIILVLIYGSAIRMDVKPVKLAICTYNQSVLERTITQEFIGSEYYEVEVTPDFSKARKLLEEDKVDVLLYLQNNFANEVQKGNGQVIIYANGVEAQLAELSSMYLNGTLAKAVEKVANSEGSKRISINTRNWFNEANESVWFLMSGQYVSIITLMSIFLGSFVIAREWDRNTIETLATTKASALEIVLSKVIVYYLLALWSMLIVLTVGQTLYLIPIRGSIISLLVSLSIYALEMICLGVLISSKLKNQFLCAQMAVILGFLPTVMLSGLIFDLRAVQLFIRIIGAIIPPTYEVKAMRISMLSGGQTGFIMLNFVIQLFWCSVFFTLAVIQVKKDCK